MTAMELREARTIAYESLRSKTGCNHHDREDIAQTVSFKLWEVKSAGETLIDQPAWIRRVAYNAWVSHCRAQDARPTLLPDMDWIDQSEDLWPDQEVVDWADNPEKGALREAHDATIRALTGPQREAWCLCVLRGASAEEASERLGVTRAAVYAWNAQTAAQLRGAL